MIEVDQRFTFFEAFDWLFRRLNWIQPITSIDFKLILASIDIPRSPLFFSGCNEALMGLALVKIGPIVISFNVTQDFFHYKSGIYQRPQGRNIMLNVLKRSFYLAAHMQKHYVQRH